MLCLFLAFDVGQVQKEGDLKSFRRIDDDDEPVVKKMRQSEESVHELASHLSYNVRIDAAVLGSDCFTSRGVPRGFSENDTRYPLFCCVCDL